MDVSHPGQTPPSANSKSVIVPSRPIMRDPMMFEETKIQSGEPKELSKRSPTKAVITPLSTETAPTTPESETLPDAKTIDELTKEAEARQQESVKPTPDEEPDEPKTTADEDKSDDKTEPKLDDATKQAEAELKEHESNQAKIQKLIESRQYNLPINTSEKRRSKRVVMLGVGLSLVLAVAWVDIALDAGLIQLSGVKPLTHFFSN